MNLKNYKNNDLKEISTLDLHTEGEPLRLIVSGYPEIPGEDMLAKRRYLQANLDNYRKAIMLEPRGHADMYGALLTKPVRDDSDYGVLFMHNEGYSSMCGHGIIAVITALVELGEVTVTEGAITCVKIDSPAGQIIAYAELEAEKLAVSFDCVASFTECVDQNITLADGTNIEFDIGFGGAYYAYVDADKHNINCSANNTSELIRLGRAIKRAIANSYPLHHPEHSDLGFLYGTIFTSKTTQQTNRHSKHVCIFADGEVDRSPTGTGVSGRAALLHHKEALALNQTIEIESIVGSSMKVTATCQHSYFGKNAVTPRVSGSAHITGQHTFYLSDNDPFQHGFFLR